jgi:eukaryotic-like serine/threonine-protein kinase
VETRAASQYQFGPFEVIPASGELRKEGNRVRIQDQPFRLLVILLENAGQVVTREEIQRRIWDSSTFVDFDSSLRVAVRKLRDALGDDADSPQFIETIPKRGYRFLAAVQPPLSAEVTAQPELAEDMTAFPVQPGEQREKPRSRFMHSKPWVVVSAVVGAVFIILAVTVTLRFRARPAKKLNGSETLVLADFANSTGDAVFDGTLRQGMTVQLQQSPFLALISDERIQQTLQLMGKPAGARLTPEIARDICERTGSAAVLDGSIASLGTQYVLGLRARNCLNGEVLDEEQVQAAKKEDVLKALDEIAARFRTRVGESLATVQSHNTPLAEATTPSVEALKAYSTALNVDLSSGSLASIPFYRRAIEIDPQFAMAYANLGLAYSDIGESVLSAESTKKAWQLRDRASDRERFFIDFTYHRQVTGNLEKAYQTLELWLQTYPRGEQPSPHDLLGGLSSQGTGRFERAIEVTRQKITDDPDFIYSYQNLASSYFFLDRFPEVESTLQKASERKIDEPYFLVIRYNIAALTGDKEQMDRAVALASGKHGAEYWLAHAEALALARSGRLQDSRRASGRAVDLALEAGEREEAATYWAARAVWEALYGNAAEAKKSALAALELSKGRDVEYAAGFALGLSGDFPRLEALAGDLEKRFPEDTFVRFTYAPVLRGLSALEHGKPIDSVERLQTALPYELAANGLNFNHFCLGGLHSAYIRGEAFLAAHRNTEAVAEFQKVLNHRGIVGLDPIGALAHLQLGRAYALSGDRINAKRAYEDLLTLWKDADPDTPILKQARAEYARLQ